MKTYKKELENALKAAELAKREVLKFYKSKQYNIETKEDNSPVTDADKAVDKIIKDYLSKKYPDHGFLTEESVDNKERLNKEYVWIIDPIDGTDSFIDGRDDFSTLIALCRNHEIVVAVISVPAKGEVYFASKWQGAFKQNKNFEVKQIHRNLKSKNLILVKSPHHVTSADEQLYEKNKDKFSKVEIVGSAYKMALIAEGKAEVTFKLSAGSKEWDIAAPSLILKEAGALLLTPDKEKYTFNKQDVVNHKGYIVVNRKKNFLN